MTDPAAASRDGMPRRVGRYAISAILGTGAFATVYRSRDERLEADVAVKVLAENHSFDADMRERFILEGRLLRRVVNQHVVAVHDAGETDRAQPFLVLELADRGDLASRVRSARLAGRRPTAADVGVVCRAVAAAMEALHAADVVHRDLAPTNLLICSVPTARPRAEIAPESGVLGADERVVVADLGLSKDLARTSGLTVGTGTAGYTPPEQREAGGWVDTRADIWSASALLVWLLTDRVPDNIGGWRRELAAAGWRPELTAALGAGLTADPSKRPVDAASWRGSVLAALSDVPSGASGATHPRRIRRALAAALLAVTLGVGGVAGWLAHRPKSPPSHLTESRLAGGRVRVTRTDGLSRAAITGPARVAVGDVARFDVDLRRITSWVWIAPDGRTYPDTKRLEVTTRSAGLAPVHVAARDSRGHLLTVTLDLRVEDR